MLEPMAGRTPRRGLIWAGVALAPLAAGVVLLSDGSAGVRFAVLLVAAGVALLGGAALLGDSALLGGEPAFDGAGAEARLAEEVAELRRELRAGLGRRPAEAGRSAPLPGSDFFPGVPDDQVFPDAEPESDRNVPNGATAYGRLAEGRATVYGPGEGGAAGYGSAGEVEGVGYGGAGEIEPVGYGVPDEVEAVGYGGVAEGGSVGYGEPAEGGGAVYGRAAVGGAAVYGGGVAHGRATAGAVGASTGVPRQRAVAAGVPGAEYERDVGSQPYAEDEWGMPHGLSRDLGQYRGSRDLASYRGGDGPYRSGGDPAGARHRGSQDLPGVRNRAEGDAMGTRHPGSDGRYRGGSAAPGGRFGPDAGYGRDWTTEEPDRDRGAGYHDPGPAAGDRHGGEHGGGKGYGAGTGYGAEREGYAAERGGYGAGRGGYGLVGGYDGTAPGAGHGEGEVPYVARRHRPSADDTNVGPLGDYRDRRR